jgi:putative NADH-flavin reductase
MKLVIFGANGQTGRILTGRALAEGHAVTAFTRHPETFPLRDGQLRVAGGSVVDLAAVEGAIAGQDAVLSSLGVPFTRRVVTTYSVGMGHILEAMRRQGVRRLVCVSSVVLVPGIDTQGGLLFEKILVPIISRTLGRTTYADLRRMERLVMDSDRDWTIVRASGLFTTPGVTAYRVAEGTVTGRFTSRSDLADFMLRLGTGADHVRRTPALATVSPQPALLRVLVREALSRRAT